MSVYGTHEEFSEAIEKHKVDAMDFPTILAMLSLIAIGLISIYSATYEPQMSRFFVKQLSYAVLGLALLVSFIFVPQHFIRTITPLAYAGSLLLLLMIFIPGVGMRINGQLCWINLGGIQFQPSEFAKLSTLMMIGRFMESKGVRLTALRDVLWLAGIVFLPMLLVLAEKDTGTASVFIAMFMGTMLWCGGDLFFLFVASVVPLVGIAGMYAVLHDARYVMIAFVAVSAIAALLFRRSVITRLAGMLIIVLVGFSSGPLYNKLPDHQQSRIKTYFDPEKYPKDEGYHVLQSMMAVGSGGVTGKGYMKGTLTQLRYIPEQWTDFIFDVPGEEFGFIGSSLVLGLLVFLIFRLVRLARGARNGYETAFTFGLAAVLFYHTTVNIGMAIGLVPVMGIPLPYLSSGGTALLANMSAIGIIIGFHRTRVKRESQF
jgi:rod shape determining protein RodA